VIAMTRRLAFVFAILSLGIQPGSASLDTAGPVVAPLHTLVGLIDQDSTRMVDEFGGQPIQFLKKRRAPRSLRPPHGLEKWLEP